jgi:hypothetical protein
MSSQITTHNTRVVAIGIDVLQYSNTRGEMKVFLKSLVQFTGEENVGGL